MSKENFTMVARTWGEKIKKFRLDKNLSYEQIFIQTKISEQFIHSLEREDFTSLPAYVFSRGFLLNLLEVYDVNSQTREIILKEFSNLYHQKETQPPTPKKFHEEVVSQNKETDKPEEQELEKSSSLPVIQKIPGDEKNFYSEEKQFQRMFFFGTGWLVVGISFIFTGLLWFYFNDMQSLVQAGKGQGGSVDTVVLEEANDSGGVYSLYNKFSTFDLVQGDWVKVFLNNRIYNFRLNGIDNTFDNKVVITFDFNNEKLVRIYLFEEIWFDVDQDGQNDILIKFQKVSGEVAIVFFSLILQNVQEIDYESIWNHQKRISILKGETVLLKDQNKTPIQIYVKATTLPVHLAYNIDGQRQNIVNLLPGNTVEIIALEHLELQIGNFRSVNLILNYIPLSFEVENPNQFSIAKIIKWLPSFRNERKHDLIIKDYIE